MGFRHGSGQTRAVPVSASVLRWSVLLALVLYAVGLAGIVNTGARADEPSYAPPSVFAEPEPEGKSCPTAPEPLAEPPPPAEGEEEPEGEPPAEVDPVVRELRSQRIEAVESCEAQIGSSRELQRRLWWSAAELNRQTAAAETANEHLVELLDGSCGNPCAVLSEGGHVEVTGLEGGVGGIGESEMTELVSAIDAGAEASQVGLYLIAGLVISCFIGYCFWRTVQSGT